MAHGFLLILLFSHIISTNVHACNQNERGSLLSFSSILSSHPLNWTSVNCCCWKGIVCNQDGLVTHLLLSSKGLKGAIFPSLSSLGNLTHLTHLNLSHNSLYGSLEIEFFLSLKFLEILDLSFNLLSGNLPFSLPSHNIQTLDLSSNRFHGAIPSSFFQQARNLTSFNVNNNTFSGLIPSSICLHSSPLIRLLDFSFNAFGGKISPGLGECSKLQILRAGNNNLSGLLPNDIYNATKLEEIAFPSNSLNGALGETIFNLTNLAILDLSFNQLSGMLSPHFGKLSKLKHLALDYNYFEGSLPPSLMNCTNLVEIHMAANNLEGDISMLNFSKLSHLSKLDLFLNHFTGTFPTCLYSCQSLKAINLASNNLEGQIQPEILSLKSLSFLSLSGFTNINGAMKILMHCKGLQTLILSYSFNGEEIPADEGMLGFGGFQNLRMLLFYYCEFTGQMPLWFSKLKNVEILIVVGSRITGPIPRSLGTLPKLLFLSLEDSQISGEFPKELCGLPRLVHESTTTQVDDYVDLPLFTTSNLVYPRRFSNWPPTISLSFNHIHGRIPTEISQIHLVHNLDLSGNNFSGNIPEQISNLKNLENLSLSMNQLSGNIPLSLASLNFLKYLNVSYNNLEGPIPTSTQLQSFNASAFEGNSKLCGAPLPNECLLIKGIDAESKNNQGVDNGHQFPWLYIFTSLGFIFGFWGVFGSLIVKKTWRYAYFQFLDNVQDRLYVMITLSMTMMKRRLRGD
ncbi:receptor-like protein 2 [Pyrus ussuriensis x Pyrus communis]|uniref:Receptor-like protein 2 n=1 Tax=Pyrus ussuriensis x Pyrus communis TaxID=2448454 RepID=A0A5N5GKC0_9ROSA|nr:receptor-like protein 2 [Pyrus ussuriensis x Pyrus communis]